MNDTPPPGTEKKPRRRSAPRKRAPSKKAKAAPETVATTADAMPAQPGDAPAASGSLAHAPTAEVATPAPLAKVATPAPAAAAAPRAAVPAPLAAPADMPASVPTPVAAVAEEADAPAQDDAPVAKVDAHAPGELPAARAVPQGSGDTARSGGANAAAAPTARTPTLRPGELVRVPLSVRWRDLDAFNHVNNSKYLSYLEEARLRWMLTLPGMGLDDDVAPVVAASNLNYKRPIGWPGDVLVELFVERIGNTSLTIGHRIIDATEGGVTYCDGNVVMVWIDRTSGRAAPLPESVRASCTRR